MSPLSVVSVRCLLARVHHHFVPPKGLNQRILLFVIPDGVASPQSDPLWNRAVLLLCFGELLLRSEGFVGLHPIISNLPMVHSSGITYRHLDCCRQCLLEMWLFLSLV